MFWELFLAAVIRAAGYRLRGKSQPTGPDLAFELPDRSVAWIEAVAPGPGNRERNADYVPELPSGVASKVPTDKIVLRITGALAAKYKAVRHYRASSQIGGLDPVVIAVNGHYAANWRSDSQPSFIERACFGAGALTLEIDRGGKVVDRFLAWQPTLQRSSGAFCETTFFANVEERRPEVSAVVFGLNDIVNNTGVTGERLGSELTTVHNPFAENPLPLGFLGVGCSITAEADAQGIIALMRHQH
jgi:hypothetical protein